MISYWQLALEVSWHSHVCYRKTQSTEVLKSVSSCLRRRIIAVTWQSLSSSDTRDKHCNDKLDIFVFVEELMVAVVGSSKE